MTVKTETIIQAYVDLRDKRSALKKKFEAMDEELVSKMDKLEGALLKRLNEAGAESLKTEAGTAYIQLKKKASCADWPSFWQWIVDNGRPDMLEKRVSASTVKEYEEENKELPPFLNVITEREVVVRRA